MPGIQDFTYLNVGKEATPGTPVAPTRKLYMASTGNLDHELTKSFHEGENRGIRIRTVRSTSGGEDVNLTAETSDGIDYDNLVVPFSFLKGGVAGVGGAADKTWTFTPSLTATNTPHAFSADIGDDTQNWRVQYLQARSFKLSAALGEMTQLSMDCFGQRAVKGAKATPGDNAAPKLVGDTWTVKYAASLAGLGAASVQTNHLIDWELEFQTGLIWTHAMDGNLYGAQSVETSIAATWTATIFSTALAVSEFYDKYVADTLDFIRLKNTGPSLGGSAYSLQVDMPILWDKPSLIDSEADGVNRYKIVGKLAADSPTAPTTGPTITLVNSLSAVP